MTILVETVPGCQCQSCPGDFSPNSGPLAADMPDDLDLGYSPAFLAATDFIKDRGVAKTVANEHFEVLDGSCFLIP